MDDLDIKILNYERELNIIWDQLNKATINKSRENLICFFHAFKSHESKIIELKDLKKSLDEIDSATSAE